MIVWSISCTIEPLCYSSKDWVVNLHLEWYFSSLWVIWVLFGDRLDGRASSETNQMLALLFCQKMLHNVNPGVLPGNETQAAIPRSISFQSLWVMILCKPIEAGIPLILD